MNGPFTLDNYKTLTKIETDKPQELVDGLNQTMFKMCSMSGKTDKFRSLTLEEQQKIIARSFRICTRGVATSDYIETQLINYFNTVNVEDLIKNVEENFDSSLIGF